MLANLILRPPLRPEKSMETLSYEELVLQFENALLTTLRAHSAASDILDTWVPDPDPINSIVNMVDSCDFDEVSGFALSVKPETINEAQIKELIGILSDDVNVSFEVQENTHFILTFTQPED